MANPVSAHFEIEQKDQEYGNWHVVTEFFDQNESLKFATLDDVLMYKLDHQEYVGADKGRIILVTRTEI